jgi:hypothetical protein
MAILPLIFLLQPLIKVCAVPASASSQLAHRHELLYLLTFSAHLPAIPAAAVTVVITRGAAPGGTCLLTRNLPGQRPVSQPATAALCRSRRQADIDNLELPTPRPVILRLAASGFLMLPVTDLRLRHRPRATVAEHFLVATFQEASVSRLPGRLLSRLGRLGRLSRPLTLQLRHCIRLPSQRRQRRFSGGAHARDDAARATAPIMGRADPHHASSPLHHA